MKVLLAGATGFIGGHLARKLEGLLEHFVHCVDLAKSTLNLAIRDYLVFAKDPWERAYRRKY